MNDKISTSNLAPRNMRARLLSAGVLLSAIAACTSAYAQASTAKLHLEPTKFDFAGTKSFGLMYFPSRIDLSSERPAEIKKEPAYKGAPMYGSVRLGNGPNAQTWFAVDSAKGVEPSIYFDKNHDGNLTDDGAFPINKGPRQENGVVEYSGTYVLPASWGDGSQETSKGEYGLNFYWSAGQKQIYDYRAAALTGTIMLDGKQHDLTIVENDNDAVFDKRYDHIKPGAKAPMAVFMFIDRDQYDIRGTFGYDDTNFAADLAPDGSTITIEPTAKMIKAPVAPVENKTELLPVGTEAPEFHAVNYDGTPLDLNALRGKTVVLKFWATWCGPCMASMPHFADIQNEVKGQNVVLLAVCVDDDQDAFHTWVTSKKAKYGFQFAYDPAGRDHKTSLLRPYNVLGIPATFIIDKTGKITAAISGYTQGDKSIEEALVKLGVKLPDVKPMMGFGG